MPHTILVLARRKVGITHEYFRQRYERHMAMIEQLAGDAMPMRHTRRYVARDDDDGPNVLAGTRLDYDVVVEMTFADERAWGRFAAALATPEAALAVAEDEAGFWDRENMSVLVVDEVRETKGQE